ncbi:MAG: hypothetical protein GY908_08235 [Flavobacteriales bacterium]|mgnify:CR=1 FL=1|nr:hypothetical protein [Flavobacteriales bacterium]
MKNSILQAVLAVGILKFTDINEDFLCKLETKKIKNEVENAIANFKKGIIDQLELQKIIFRNQQKLDDVLIEYA